MCPTFKMRIFWGDIENVVRIQIHVVIITYCLIAIIEHYLHLDRAMAKVLRIPGSSRLVKDNLKELLGRGIDDGTDSGQLEIEFNCQLF